MKWHRSVGGFLWRLSRGVVAYNKAFVFVRDLGLAMEERVPFISVAFRVATPQDIDSLTAQEHGYGEVETERAKRRVEEGQLCTIGVHEGKIIFITWIYFGQFEYAGVTLPLGPGWAHPGDTRMVEQYRNKGLAQAGNYYCSSLARSKCAKRYVSWVDVRNRASLLAFRKTGSRNIGTMWTVLLLRRWRFTRVPKWLEAYLLSEPGRSTTTP